MPFMSKQDQVADILRERVIAGTYQRGQRLKQADIANELGVSITTVREALHVLEAEGYVVGVSHRGLLVPEINIKQAGEIQHLRLVLEKDLTAAALKVMTPSRLAELRALHDAVAAAAQRGDRYASRTANYRFHFRLYEWADSPQTLSFVRILWAKYPFTMQEAGSNRHEAMLAEHERILDTIEAGDPQAAVAAMGDHIDAGWRQLLAAAPNAVTQDA